METNGSLKWPSEDINVSYNVASEKLPSYSSDLSSIENPTAELKKQFSKKERNYNHSKSHPKKLTYTLSNCSNKYLSLSGVDEIQINSNILTDLNPKMKAGFNVRRSSDSVDINMWFVLCAG